MSKRKDNDSIQTIDEKIAGFDLHSFEREFARRTLANLKFVEKEVEERHSKGITDNDIDDVFEITQLVNSFVGMLILPKEAYYKAVRNEAPFRSEEANIIIHRLSRDSSRYSCTYTYKTRNGNQKKEYLTPKNLARHFRNAVAHDNLTIIPQDLGQGGSITGIVFKDRNNSGEEFSLELTVDEIRVLLSALCELILTASKSIERPGIVRGPGAGVDL